MAHVENHSNHSREIPYREMTISPSGIQRWWVDGKLHREDGPAVIIPNNRQMWYQHGELHRVDGPAIIFDDGLESFCAFNYFYDSFEELQIGIILNN